MIQTVKCSPLVDLKFNQGFYDPLCTLNLFFCKGKFFSLAAPFRQSYCLLHCSHLVIFYFEEKFCVSHASASHLRDVYFQSVPKTLCKK